MATINFVLQGKGGVGKSLIAYLLALYYLSCKCKTICIDTDPVNSTFAGYKALNVIHAEVLKDDNVSSREFDKVVETLINAPESSSVVIDNGASTFLPLCAYLKENDVVSYLQNLGHTVRFHSVITGGQALIDTMNGLEALLVNFPEVPVVVWLNEYFGAPSMNGTSFEETRLFNNSKHNIHSLIKITERDKATFGHDFSRMLKERLTFDEAIKSPSFCVMSKQRLYMIRKDINNQISQANL